MNITGLLVDYNNKKSSEQNDEFTTFVAYAISYVIHNYFLTMAPSFLMILSSQYPDSSRFYGEMLTELFHTWGTPMVQVIFVSEGVTDRINGIELYNLLLVDSYAGFRNLDVVSYTADYHYNEYYYIFLQARDHMLQGEMERIFAYCWRNHIINCTIQIQNANGEVLVYTYFPYGPFTCNSVAPVLINQFNGTSMVHEDIFPKKLRNFYGCPLRAALWHVPPFVFLKTHANGSHEITGGFEAKLLTLLAQTLNFTIDIIVPPNNERIGIMFPNGSMNGAFGMLQRNMADISMGAIGNSIQRRSTASPTTTYYQTQQAVVVLISAFQRSSFEIMSYPFNWKTWLIFLSFIVLTLVVLAFLNRYFCRLSHDHRFQYSYLNLFLLTMGMPVTRMSRWIFSRILNMNWMIFTLIMRACYQAMLFDLIRKNVLSRFPSELEELMGHKYRMVMHQTTFQSLQNIPMFNDAHMDITNINDSDEVLKYIEMTSDRYVVGAGPYEFFKYYVKLHKKPGVFRNMGDIIMIMQTTMFLKKHSFLLDQFNYMITWIRVTGVMRFWQDLDLDGDYFKSSHMKTDRILGLDELYAIFYIVLMLMAVSTLLFVCEILSKRFRIFRRFFD